MTHTTVTRTRSTYRHRAGLALAGFALAIAACGGGDAATESFDGAAQNDATETNSADSGSADSGSADSGSADSGGAETGRSAPIDPAAVDPVVDTCAILTAQQLSDLSNAFDSFLERDYVSETEGAGCVYTWDNSVVRIIVGSSSQVVNEPPPSLILGELVSRPWDEDGAVTLWGDEWSGVITNFFAYLESGEYGITIHNVNGTSIDSSGEGALYGRALVAAAANLG